MHKSARQGNRVTTLFTSPKFNHKTLAGVETGLVVNFLACALQFYLLSISDSMTMLFLSKVPGICLAGFLCAQTAMAKITAEGPERVVAL